MRCLTAQRVAHLPTCDLPPSACVFILFHWRNHQQERFCSVITPIVVASIAVRLIVITLFFHRIVNRNGRSFAPGVRSVGNILVALALRFRRQT